MRAVLSLSVLVATSASAGVSINPGLSGSWYNPSTPGQGLLIDVIPHRNQVVVGWFTFDGEASLALGAAGQRWFTAEGGFVGDRAELTVFNTSGGQFNAPMPVVTAPAGQAALVFASCTQATLSFSLDDGPAGEIELVRLSPDVFCAAAAANPALPAYFRLIGSAAGEDEAGNYAECHFDLLYEISEVSRLPGLVEYRGTGGGEIARLVQDSTGAGFAFFADFFVPDVEGRVFGDGRVELDGPGKGVDDSRLYLNLARYYGSLDTSGAAQGEWTCGPFDVDVGGYADTLQTVRGTWQLESLDDPGNPTR